MRFSKCSLANVVNTPYLICLFLGEVRESNVAVTLESSTPTFCSLLFCTI